MAVRETCTRSHENIIQPMISLDVLPLWLRFYHVYVLLVNGKATGRVISEGRRCMVRSIVSFVV